MPPFVIADSDDEDESYLPGRVELDMPQAQCQAATRTLDGGSNDTISTDPYFFQTGIYEEQQGALQEIPYEELPDSAVRDAVTSSAVTAPAPFQRIVTGLIDPSSLTSVSDPTNRTDTRMPNGRGGNDWTQVSTPGRKRAPTAVMDDLWDVPSSPEVGQGRMVPKTRLKRGDAQPVSKVGKKQKPTTHPENGQTSGVHSHHERLEFVERSPSGTRKRKRTKPSHSHSIQSSSDAVNLVSMPFSNDEGVEPLSMLPPTLPLDYNPSFHGSTIPLPDTQRPGYGNPQLPSSSGLPEHFVPQIYQQDMHMMGFAGTPTNVNTPRSDGIGFSTAPLPSNTTEAEIAKDLPAQHVPQHPNSSPDIIAILEPPTKPKPTKQSDKKKRSKSDSPIKDDNRSNNVPNADIQIDKAPPPPPPPPVNLQTNDQDSDYLEKPAKPKKTRGRPRKKAGEETAQPPKEPAASNLENIEAPSKQKKKRGRPKKQGRLAAADESPQVTTISPDMPETVQVEAAQHASKSEVLKEGGSTMYETIVEKDDDSLPIEEVQEKREPSVLKETNQNTTLPKAGDPAEEENPKAEPPETPMVKKEEKPKTPASGGTGQAKGLSALLSKPIYRVGLSKRSRIAPLLKSIRK
ncbi:hypothetical protein BGZ63DRAFT_396608 [Mariannaea sp. PMI_226]|nr:hypothetical protein BGZ63DRAFT_396608 [Mariannaea sp. PMI_226]